jgi:hypothetical protein
MEGTVVLRKEKIVHLAGRCKKKMVPFAIRRR